MGSHRPARSESSAAKRTTLRFLPGSGSFLVSASSAARSLVSSGVMPGSEQLIEVL
jgi:hypothetical protein